MNLFFCKNTNRTNLHESFYSCLNPTPIRVDSRDSWSFTNAIRGYCLDHIYSCRFERFVVSITTLTPPFLWFPWNLRALIRTSIRVIRAECGEVTHSASPSTHRYPYNPDYPWSAKPFSSLSSFRPFSELKPYFECCRCAQNLTK